jgi:chromate transporter
MRVRELVGLFLKLGLTAFGGPAAHIAMMKEEVVTRRGWMTDLEFLDLLGATNLLPGPNSTQMAIHIGLRRGGLKGSVLAGVCFVAPAAAMVFLLAVLYAKYGSLPLAEAILYGVKPVIIAIVIYAIWGLVGIALKNRWYVALGIAALSAALLGADVLLVLFVSGALASTIDWLRPRDKRQPLSSLLRIFAIAAAMIVLPDALTRLSRPADTTPAPYGPVPLFSFFLKVGLTLYGGGYVLIAFLRDELVYRWHWLTEAQLLDAIAAGQITPGPLSTTAAFIGYLVGGASGALIATIAIFLPSFVLVALSGPLIPRVRRSRLAGVFLDGVNVAALGLMAAVTADLGRAALVDGFTAALAVVSLLVLFRYRINSVWLIGAGAVCGLAKELI